MGGASDDNVSMKSDTLPEQPKKYEKLKNSAQPINVDEDSVTPPPSIKQAEIQPSILPVKEEEEKKDDGTLTPVLPVTNSSLDTSKEKTVPTAKTKEPVKANDMDMFAEQDNYDENFDVSISSNRFLCIQLIFEFHK